MAVWISCLLPLLRLTRLNFGQGNGGSVWRDSGFPRLQTSLQILIRHEAFPQRWYGQGAREYSFGTWMR